MTKKKAGVGGGVSLGKMVNWVKQLDLDIEGRKGETADLGTV